MSGLFLGVLFGYLIGSAVTCQGFCLVFLEERDFVWVVFRVVYRGFDWVYYIAWSLVWGPILKLTL